MGVDTYCQLWGCVSNDFHFILFLVMGHFDLFEMFEFTKYHSARVDSTNVYWIINWLWKLHVKFFSNYSKNNYSFLHKNKFFEKYIFENFDIFTNKASMPITKPTPITKWPNSSHAYLCPNNKPSIGNHHRPNDQMFGGENGFFHKHTHGYCNCV